MVTQTIAFDGPSISEIGSGTITAFLFSGTTLSATLSTIQENSTLKGRYTGTVTDIAAGEYRVVVKFDGYTVSEPDYKVDLLLTVGTYVAAMDYGAAVIADAVWDEARTGHTTSGTFGFYLDAAVSGVSGGGGGGTGTGARTVTITVNDGSTVLQNAKVRLTEGANTFTGLTNVSGVVTFNVDDATYTVSITKSGYSYAGTTLVVDGAETVTYSMTVVSVTPPDDPALCAVTIPIVNQFGEALSGEPVEIRFNEFATGADTTAIVLSPPPALTSAAGLVAVNLLRDGKYSVFYGQDDYKRRLDFTVPDAGSFTVGE